MKWAWSVKIGVGGWGGVTVFQDSAASIASTRDRPRIKEAKERAFKCSVFHGSNPGPTAFRFGGRRKEKKLGQVLQFVGPNGAVQLFGVKLVGVNSEDGKKLLFSIVYIILVWLLAWAIGKLAAALVGRRSRRAAFWTKQGIHLFSAAALVIGLCSIWFSDPARLATAFGLVTAGLAFALQRVITALAAYIVILRGKTFNIGDRIVMGGVRGDVIELGFIQTTIMEMGEPASVQSADPAMWVRSRQYTGRIVTLTNDKIFDTPVYNYTREFPYIWEEMLIPVSFETDLKRVEQILLAAAEKETVQLSQLGEGALAELERRFFVQRSELAPRVFVRLTDNWVELSVRFVVAEHGVREVKDRLSREVLNALNQARIGIASSTYDIVGMPTLSVKIENPTKPEPEQGQSGSSRSSLGPAAVNNRKASD